MTPVWIDSQKNISHAEIVSEATGTPLSTTLKSQFEKCQNPNGYRVFFCCALELLRTFGSRIVLGNPEGTFKTPRKNVQNSKKERSKLPPSPKPALVRYERSMSKSCKGMLEEFLKCVEKSDCVHRHSLNSCLKSSILFPQVCATARDVYVSCKRGQFDMRSRLRGNKGYWNTQCTMARCYLCAILRLKHLTRFRFSVDVPPLSSRVQHSTRAA